MLAVSGVVAFILAKPLYVTLGIRIYPAYATTLAGFFMPVEYCAGIRNDVIRLEYKDDASSTAWGNGFRFGAAYDFSQLTRGIAPIAGAAWKLPRGRDTSDNYLTVYISLGFII
ncbi:MAG: hypothetical protein Pg6C_05440 [Treponemataceae bacterium]|nr:MAG: hypothetical protein Pg6C_05440 [Treponemataceae bacterium]